MKCKRKRVAIIGSQGVPAKYGGFETLVDNILSARRPELVDYTVFCSSPDMDTTMRTYRGCRLKYVKLRAHGILSVPYDIVSMLRAISGYDAVLMLGVSGGLFIPVFRLFSRAKVIVNIDGLEYMRDKWSKRAKRFLRWSLKSSIFWAHEIVSDNKGIRDFVKNHYNREATLIAYGGDHTIRKVNNRRQLAILDFYNLESGNYDLSICRIEPENNCHITLQAYDETERNIVFVGNWNHSEYSRKLYKQYSHKDNIRLIRSTYDLDILYAIRNHARYYVHGHKAGGTNPSLVEAMFIGKPILWYDVLYNRETMQNTGYSFNSAEQLKKLILTDNLSGEASKKIARRDYTWHKIAEAYESLY
ncbi:MAG: DUF1972 domain-containing protein [Candidatus Amulumruptor caecigallinarius]|nr:DUF1972 domain-containing protein [Candidatus Amulumruptor caecigallinarius]